MQHRLPTRTHALYTIAILGFIYTIHVAVPIYSNSSFLSLFVNEQTVGLIYMLGAAVSILGFLIVPVLIRHVGNYTTAILLICIQIALMFGLVVSDTASTIAFLFIMQSAIVALIALSLDVFLQVNTDEQKVGTVRAIYMTSINFSWVLAPLIASMIINGTDNYRNTYVIALAMLFPLLYLIHRNFPKFKDPHYSHPSPWQLIKLIFSKKDWVKIFVANSILQVFYAWMVVYCPIYLHQTIGLSWEEIGIVFTVMLIPFALIQYPLGKIADTKYGEKEIMAIGFGIMGVATIALSFLTVPSVVMWSVGLFATRVGAAAAEIMLETYFFKTVSSRDTAVLGGFRITRPLSYIIAPLITGAGLYFTTHQFLFVIIGVVCLLGLWPALTIRDTR
ncbi:MAG: MFS transporter [Patescibacteria group bacterium]